MPADDKIRKEIFVLSPLHALEDLSKLQRSYINPVRIQ